MQEQGYEKIVTLFTKEWELVWAKVKDSSKLEVLDELKESSGREFVIAIQKALLLTSKLVYIYNSEEAYTTEEKIVIMMASKARKKEIRFAIEGILSVIELSPEDQVNTSNLVLYVAGKPNKIRNFHKIGDTVEARRDVKALKLKAKFNKGNQWARNVAIFNFKHNRRIKLKNNEILALIPLNEEGNLEGTPLTIIPLVLGQGKRLMLSNLPTRLKDLELEDLKKPIAVDNKLYKIMITSTQPKTYILGADVLVTVKTTDLLKKLVGGKTTTLPKVIADTLNINYGKVNKFVQDTSEASAKDFKESSSK